LFATLEDLRDAEKPDIERAKAICSVSQVIIDTGKLEVAVLHALNEGAGGADPSPFFEAHPDTKLIEAGESEKRPLRFPVAAAK